MIMVETAGQLLQAARARRKLSLEDASRATKIRVRQLADLERDEYSNFPNLAYAKGFLISYGKYLAVDVRPYLDAFEDASTFGLDNYQYLSEVPLGVYRATRRPTRRRTGRKSYTVLACALGVLVLASIGWSLYVNYERLGDLDKLADRQEERAPGATGGLAANPAPSPAAPSVAAEASSTGFSHPAHRMEMPLPDDGAALRDLLADTGAGLPPFLLFGDPAPAQSAVTERRGAWSPENLEGYRFYVRSIDRTSVEIFRTSVARPETVLNSPL